MDVILWLKLLKNASLGIGILGILVGLDIICGAKFYSVLNKFLVGIASLDKKLTATPNSRKILGVMIFILSLTILLLSKT